VSTEEKHLSDIKALNEGSHGKPVGYNDFAGLLVTQKGPILEILLNRPEAANSLTGEMEVGIHEIFREAGDDDSVKVVVVRGAGKTFSAGHDLKEVADWFVESDGQAQILRLQGVPALRRPWYFNKPVVAGVQGYVGPMALIYLSMFDFIIAAEGTRFSWEQARRGGVLPLSTLMFRLPMGVYKKLTMMGGWFDADKAERLDLVQKVVPEGQLEDEVWRWAKELAKIPTAQHVAMKRKIHRQYELMGLLSMLEPVHPGGHGTEEDFEFYRALKEEGMAAALKMRDDDFDIDLAQIT